MNVDKATIARTVILVLALLNIILEKFGIKALPIDDELVSEVVSVGFLLYSVITNWWHNNSFTKEAKQADEYLKELKGAK
ncbi:MAG TPA: phage holin [Ruminococcaceae bacterium]|nr:phage holin [Oscillospiraceae bacterium]